MKEQTKFHQYLNKISDDLYQSSSTGIYYGTVERDGKQIRRSLKTNDRTLALQRQRELQAADAPDKVGFASTKEKPDEWTQTLARVGDNLYRSDETGMYYGLFKRNGRQIRRSLKTKDRALAQRKLQELREKVDGLDTTDAATVVFSEMDEAGKLVGGLALRWWEAETAGLLPRSRDAYMKDLKNPAKFFRGKIVRNITRRDLEDWKIHRLNTRAGADGKSSPLTFNRTFVHVHRIFDYAVKHGLRLDNPADDLKRAKVPKTALVIPTRQEFCDIIADVRRPHRGRSAEHSADLLEGLAYSGARISELVGDKKYKQPPMSWDQVSFEANAFSVLGKGGKWRTLPLFPALRELLLRMLKKLPRKPEPKEPIFKVTVAEEPLNSACKRLNLPHWSHHDMRHFFCSNAIEIPVDFKTIADWLGHTDGGVLVARTYGHLRQEHSDRMATKMTFSTQDPSPANVVDLPEGETDDYVKMARELIEKETSNGDDREPPAGLP